MKKSKADIRSNLWKIYTYKFCGEAYLIAPLLIPFYLANGLNATQIFTIQASFHLSLLLLEIPSGYLADVIGRKKTLVIGAVSLPLGLAIYACTRSFLLFVLAEFFCALSVGMRSGCDSALIFDTLLQAKEAHYYKKFEGRSILFTRIGSAAASIAGGLTATISMRFPFFLNTGTVLPMIPLSLSLTEPERSKPRGEHPFSEILKITLYAFRHPQLRFLILLSALVMSSGLIGIWSYFLLYRSLHIPIGYFGVLFAASQLASALGAYSTHRICQRIGDTRAFWLLPVSGIGLVLLGAFPSFFVLPVILLNHLAWGFSYPLLLHEMNQLISSEVRATLLSVASMSGSLLFAVLSLLFGKVVDHFSLSTAFISLGSLTVLVQVPLIIRTLSLRSGISSD